MGTSGPPSRRTPDDTLDVFTRGDSPGRPLTTGEVADALDRTEHATAERLEALVECGELETREVGSDRRLWWRPPDRGSAAQSGTESTLEQAQFRELVQSVTDYAIFVLDPDGIVQTWNRGAEQLKGYEEDEIIGEHFSTFYTDEDRENGIPERNLARAREDGRTEDKGWRLRNDGERFWASVTITSVRDDDGELRGFVKVTRDMTERHEYEQRLREQKRRFETLVREVKDYAIFLLDSDGIVQTWNRGAEQLKGYEEDEIVGEHFSTFYTDEARENGVPERNLEKAVENGRVEDEGKRVQKGGGTFWANVTITALHDDDGNLRGFAKVTRDMTERHLYEQRLRSQRDELDELNQINAVIRDIDQALVTATSREEIEQEVCDRLAASNTYSAAWTAEYTEDYETITPRAWAGVSDEYLDAIRTTDAEIAERTEKGVGATALRTREVQPVQYLRNDPAGEPWRDASLTAGYESAITVPLRYNEVEYGVLTVYAEHESAFDERKIAVMSELGETISHAIAAIRRKEREQTLTALQESTRGLLQTETREEIGDIIVETLTDDIALADAVVYSYDADEDVLELMSSSRGAESTTERARSLTAEDDEKIRRSIADGVTLFEGAAPTDDADETGERRTMVVPLGEYGALAVEAADQGTFDENMESLVELVAATAEAALKRTDRERRLQRQKDRLDSFASMLAHELRNPVTIGQIYGSQLPAEAAPDAVEYVTEAFDRIEDMIDVLLVLARGQEAVEEGSAVRLADVAAQAWGEVETPEATLDVALDTTRQADETYIRHLFRNLFENAVEHGGSDVTVTVGDLPNGFYVADDGPGIPKNDRKTVFEAGYTTAAEEGGTGLGLAFVQQLAEVYEWDCRVTESETGGARFEFTNFDD
ncbi:MULTISPECIES: PAS domain S-box protein [Halorussus]|uniref:PAS domain S-box protein n=1 Tax=Halorussus TaxID=1070314 RepID=UPI00209ED8E9|nr:PAS domain S-box protein [Halorussus vallis]USZ74435.1 PAS domain S-box protein [Halorussus vallis]